MNFYIQAMRAPIVKPGCMYVTRKTEDDTGRFAKPCLSMVVFIKAAFNNQPASDAFVHVVAEMTARAVDSIRKHEVRNGTASFYYLAVTKRKFGYHVYIRRNLIVKSCAYSAFKQDSCDQTACEKD